MGKKGKFHKIPTRTLVYGDIVKGKTLEGFAKRQLLKLEEEMAFQNLKIGRKKIRLNDGSEISVSKQFDFTNIEIFVPGQPVPPPTKIKNPRCYCSPTMAVGKILEVYRGTGGGYPCLLEHRWWYDVAICQGHQYVKLEGFHVRSAGWEKYDKDDYVIVGYDTEIYHSLPDFCGEEDCLVADMYKLRTLTRNLVVVALWFSDFEVPFYLR